MNVVLRKDATLEEVNALRGFFLANGFGFEAVDSQSQPVFLVTGDFSTFDEGAIRSFPFVKDIISLSSAQTKPHNLVDKIEHPMPSQIQMGNAKIGNGCFAVIAGPCSVESEEQLLTIAQAVKASGATLLRGGAFKPRTSPYAFQGLGKEGLRLLVKAKKEVGLPIVTEIMEIAQLDAFDEVDVIQVGARNMQNFELLKQLGKLQKPVLLKRGLCATYEEWLMSAEYIMVGGNNDVILCERGIRTFETYTRNTFDVTAVPALKELSHLPILVDPSHATGKASLVPSMALAGVASGADGLMVEVHNHPDQALSDGPQSLTLAEFDKLMRSVNVLRQALLPQ